MEINAGLRFGNMSGLRSPIQQSQCQEKIVGCGFSFWYARSMILGGFSISNLVGWLGLGFGICLGLGVLNYLTIL